MRRFVDEVQNQHNLAALDELFSPDMIDQSGMTNPPNLEGVRAFFTMMFTAFPDMHFTIRQQLAEGDKVMTFKTFRGTHAGPFLGIPATGKEVAFDNIDIMTVRKGKITDLVQGQPVRFQYRLRAKVPMRVTVPRSLAYDYYNPELAGEQRSIQITVEEGES